MLFTVLAIDKDITFSSNSNCSINLIFIFLQSLDRISEYKFKSFLNHYKFDLLYEPIDVFLIDSHLQIFGIFPKRLDYQACTVLHFQTHLGHIGSLFQTYFQKSIHSLLSHQLKLQANHNSSTEKASFPQPNLYIRLAAVLTNQYRPAHTKAAILFLMRDILLLQEYS